MLGTGCKWAQILDLILERNSQRVSHSPVSIWFCGRLPMLLQMPVPQEGEGDILEFCWVPERWGAEWIFIMISKEDAENQRQQQVCITHTHTLTKLDCQHFLEDQAVLIYILPSSTSSEEVPVIPLEWSYDLQALISSLGSSADEGRVNCQILHAGITVTIVIPHVHASAVSGKMKDADRTT